MCRGNSSWVFPVEKALAGERIALVSPNSQVNVIFCEAGFRPGRRGPFVSAKGPKTTDAPSGLMGKDGRQFEEGGPTRSAQTRPTD